METAWKKYDKNELKKCMNFNDGYIEYLSNSKTERESVVNGIKLAEAHGFKNVNEYIANKKTLKAGDKIYFVNLNKDLVLMIIGSKPMEEGLLVLGAHVDSPRLDLKQHPLYEDSEIALLDTHYYGGIKNYQWVALPLALHGVVCKKDGSKVDIVIGENPKDPVVGISDLLPHLAGKQMAKKGNEIVEGEDLNVTIGSIPLKGEKDNAVKANILKLLKKKYDIEEDDFISAEIEVVPAGKARSYGLDESMVMGYGQDDRVCAYTSLMAMFEIEKPEKTCACLLVDKEEIGSVGATGMHSEFFENLLVEVMELKEGYSEIKFRRMNNNTKMLSSDVSVAFDPNYPAVTESKNTCYFGRGLVFNKYTGSRGKSGCNDANPEYIAEIRAAMDKHNVSWQTAELGRVNEGGGGTIAYIMANKNMNVIDAGIGVQNMHAPWEVTSKADNYEATKGYVAFLKEL